MKVTIRQHASQEVAHHPALERVVVGLVAEVAQTFVATGFGAATGMLHSLVRGLKHEGQLLGDVLDVARPTGNVVVQHEGGRCACGIAVERAIEVVAPDAQALRRAFEQRIDQRAPQDFVVRTSTSA